MADALGIEIADLKKTPWQLQETLPVNYNYFFDKESIVGDHGAINYPLDAVITIFTNQLNEKNEEILQLKEKNESLLKEIESLKNEKADLYKNLYQELKNS